MSKLSQQLNKENPSTEAELNGFIENSPIYVTSYPPGAPHQQPLPQPQQQNQLQQQSAGGTGTPGAGVRQKLSNGHALPEEELVELKQEIGKRDTLKREFGKQDIVKPEIVKPEIAKQEIVKQQIVKPEIVKPEIVKPEIAKQEIVKQEIVKQEISKQEIAKQEPGKEERPAEPVPPPEKPKTPVLFANGGTELLIGLERGTNHQHQLLDKPHDYVTRPRRRSGGVVAEKEPVGVVGGEEDQLKMMVVSLDNGPHRELPVDVPDSFMPSNKTPPRYPPPRPRPPPIPQQTSVVGSVVQQQQQQQQPPPSLVAGLNGTAAPPRPPSTVNNNTEPPTKQQLDSIRKYQEQLRKRREDEEELASLRGSKKLAHLESRPPAPLPAPAGLVNQAFTADELQPSLYSPVGLGEVVGAAERVASAGRSLGLDCSGLQALVQSADFRKALGTLATLHRCWPLLARPAPVAADAQALARDCVESLQRSSVAEAAELTELLSRYEFEGLLYSHDLVARDLQMPPECSSPPLPPPPTQAPPPPPPPHEEESNIKIIKIEKTNEPLGATVRNEGESVIIGRVVRGGAAEKSGLLHEGDEVLEVNGIEMRGKSVNDVCDLLSAMTGTLTFLVVPSKHHRPHRDTLMHVKANFDYDPEEDLYIPCRELGVSFQKGDILHVICQDDPNWWQAFREGEEDQTLAGLIPSKTFQHQRESMKQAITGDRLSKEKSKKAGTFLCAKKNTKKKKKKSPYGGYESGYPIYASNADEYEADEILTYDEVGLYYPRANHKRPIVLIGPPNIGRHELRQRLMEDSERFAAAVPHTSRPKKEGEVDGTDYHFISRAQFEADILARRFVEHGEYEKALYGTSVEAIRSVVAGGKICVLNLHPQSLRILRASDLKPYVVFVAPPSLEKLRQKKIRSGEAYKEEELKDIIEKAREMEDKYGHYFDMIINNNDTERAYHQLLSEINILEREPQWVPAAWLKSV